MKNLLKTKMFLGLIFLISEILCDKDLYKILQLPRNASQNDIKKKYRELTRLYHPDKNQGNKDASAKFAEVAEAYEILSDPKKRRKYDQGGMDAVNNENQPGNFDPFDIFGMFGGGGRRNRENRDHDLKIKLRATLKDLYLGREYEYIYTRNTMCPHCRGSGADSSEDIQTCTRCNGQGMVIERQQIAPGFVQQFQNTCPKCKGKGKTITKHCHKCQGKKIVKGLEELTIYIEKGMPDGFEIKFDDFGEERPDMLPGNLIFIIQELSHNTFRREKNNLHTTLQITLKEALLGFEKEIKHLDDHIVTVKKDGVVQPGDIIKIRGEGMPHHQSSETGDLFVKIDILFPTILTEKQKEIAKVLFNKRSYW